MSERTTHNIIASTNAGINALALEVPAAVYDDIMARWREAADRLAELDASNQEIIADCNRCLGELRAVKALLPDSVSIEQLVATYNAVMAEPLSEAKTLWRVGFNNAVAHLRSVKP